MKIGFWGRGAGDVKGLCGVGVVCWPLKGRVLLPAATLIPTIASRQQYVIKRNWWLSIEEALKREFARSEIQ